MERQNRGKVKGGEPVRISYNPIEGQGGIVSISIGFVPTNPNELDDQQICAERSCVHVLDSAFQHTIDVVVPKKSNAIEMWVILDQPSGASCKLTVAPALPAASRKITDDVHWFFGVR